MNPQSILTSVLILVWTTLSPAAANAALCLNWGEPYRVGQVDPTLLPEASGVQASRRFPGRLYHHNDSGGAGEFFVTDLEGRGTRRVSVQNFHPIDFEDIGVGPCPDSRANPGKSCLFLADIGDNSRGRASVEVVWVEELANFPDQVVPLGAARLRYPDQAHNAESIAIQLNGDLFIATKEKKGDLKGKSLFFRVEASALAKSPAASAITLQPWGEIDFHVLLPLGAPKTLVTGMDISPTGKTLLLLTYEQAYEFDWDLTLAHPLPPTATLREGRDYQKIQIEHLEQQEGISYLADGRSFVYDTETAGTPEAPILRVDCDDRR